MKEPNSENDLFVTRKTIDDSRRALRCQPVDPDMRPIQKKGGFDLVHDLVYRLVYG